MPSCLSNPVRIGSAASLVGEANRTVQMAVGNCLYLIRANDALRAAELYFGRFLNDSPFFMQFFADDPKDLPNQGLIHGRMGKARMHSRCPPHACRPVEMVHDR